MKFVEGRLKRSEKSDSQLPLLIRRDMGLFGVLNEIANSEEEGKYFSLQPSLVLLLASPSIFSLTRPGTCWPSPFPFSPVSPGPIAYTAAIFTSPLHLPRIPE